ncbi:MAG TPA: hypothetical protein VHT25_00660 [Solirubrobacteraceae bacterium]|jgi:hypothetical protein|nr:hypothetical protein [Solirubrobacteraceae bacterium]
MSTSSPLLEAALGGLPSALRTRLLKRHEELKRAYANAQYDVCGLRAGKFAEVMLRVLQHELTGSYSPFGQQLRPIDQEAAALEKLPKSVGADSLRVIMPRALSFLYTLRNKRGIGHEGGDVDANEIDSATCVRTADWCLSELVRVVHAISLEEAQALLDAIAEREVPHVWSIAGVKRVLNPNLTAREQVLILLYSDPETAVPIEDLLKWVEYSRMDHFRTKVITPLHKQRLIEFDRETKTVLLSPSGSDETEKSVLPKIKV